MTQSPHGGQTAARYTDYDSTEADEHTRSNGDADGVSWGGSDHESTRSRSQAQDPAYGGRVQADAPTGTMPQVSDAPFRPGSSSGASSAGSASSATSAADATTTTAPPASPTSRNNYSSTSTSSSAGASTRATNGSAPSGANRSRGRGPRRARLQLRHINPWTVLKFSCVLSIALFFVWLIVVGVLFGVLDAAGIIGKVNDTVVQLNGPGSSPPITSGIVFGGAAIIGVVNIVLFIALSTIGSVIYNLCADLVGGVEVTLSER